MEASALRRVAAGLVAATGGIVVAALALEIGLRIAGYRQPVLLEDSLRNVYSVEPNAAFTYYGYMPGAVEDFANPLKLNALGFHDRDYSPERPSPTTYRIMVLGDSYVAAWEVPLEETFHKRLEARLEREDPLGRGSYQVIAFGQGRSAQEQEIQWMRRYASIYQPDVILYLFFCGNDFMENDPVTFSEASSFGVRYTREVAARKIKLFRKLLLFPELRLNGLVAEAAAEYYVAHLDWFDRAISRADLESPELGIYQNPLPAEWAAAFEQTAKLLDVARKETCRLHARFVLASLSGPQVIGEFGERLLWAESEDSRFDYGRADRWIRDWAERHHVPHVELGPPLAKIGRQKVFWKHDQHLNPEGHAVVADLLYDVVLKAAREASMTESGCRAVPQFREQRRAEPAGQAASTVHASAAAP
jgi:lysophospholipase L1-like esterase